MAIVITGLILMGVDLLYLIFVGFPPDTAPCIKFSRAFNGCGIFYWVQLDRCYWVRTGYVRCGKTPHNNLYAPKN